MTSGQPRRPRNSFGSVYEKRRRDGTRYPGFYVRFVEGGKRVERGGFATKTHARTFLAGKRVEKSERRALGLPDVRPIAVRDLVEAAKTHARAHLRAGGLPSRFLQLDHFAARYGDRPADSIRTGDVLAHLDYLRGERRYSDPRLTSSVYTILGREDERRGVAGLPDLDRAPEAEAARATGTDGAAPRPPLAGNLAGTGETRA